jgi:hypothetical protein
VFTGTEPDTRDGDFLPAQKRILKEVLTCVEKGKTVLSGTLKVSLILTVSEIGIS